MKGAQTTTRGGVPSLPDPKKSTAVCYREITFFQILVCHFWSNALPFLVQIMFPLKTTLCHFWSKIIATTKSD